MAAAATTTTSTLGPALSQGPGPGPEQRASLLCTPKHRVAASANRRSLRFTARASSNPGAKVSIPKQWYNLIADLPVKPPPQLHPQTHQPLNPSDLSPLFPDELIRQEVTDERFVDIPEEVIDVYKLWRPTPLIRARRLEKLLGTPAKIYYKYEGTSPAGSHKPNTAVPQAWYNAAAGVKNVVTETGAGQWGSALSFASSLFGLNCEVWQVRASFDQKPYRRLMMETWGAKVHPSPSTATEAGKKILEADPSSPGSLGIAISEAVEVAATNADTKYCLGSVLNHVLLHQTVIGEECLDVSYMGQYYYAMGRHMHSLLQAQFGKPRWSTKEGTLREMRHRRIIQKQNPLAILLFFFLPKQPLSLYPDSPAAAVHLLPLRCITSSLILDLVLAVFPKLLLRLYRTSYQ